MVWPFHGSQDSFFYRATAVTDVFKEHDMRSWQGAMRDGNAFEESAIGETEGSAQV